MGLDSGSALWLAHTRFELSKNGWYTEGVSSQDCNYIACLPKLLRRCWPRRWLEGIRDWCISRQLWWGHRIPAYYITLADEPPSAPGGPSERGDRWVVAHDETAARAAAEARFPGREVALAQARNPPPYPTLPL